MNFDSIFNFNAHKHSIFGIVIVFIWLGLFCVGMLIDSKPYRDALAERTDTLKKDTTKIIQVAKNQSITVNKSAKPEYHNNSNDVFDQPFKKVTSMVMKVIIFWTPTNVALLSMLAGLAGGLSRRIWRLKPIATNATKDPNAEIDFSNTSSFSGVIVGFVVYLAFISGTLLAMDNPFANTSQGQYIRTAGFISLFAFSAAYEPSIFINILRYLTSLKKNSDEKK